MNKSLASFILSVILIDSEAETNIIIKPHTTTENGFCVNVGFFLRQTAGKTAGDIGNSNDANTLCRGGKNDISNTDMTRHIKG